MALVTSLTILVAIFLESSLSTGEEAVTVKSDKTPCLIGENLTLTCKFKKRTPVVKWIYGDKSILRFTDKKSCQLNPIFKEVYSFSCNPDTNEFNLIILNVTTDDNRKELVCTDGGRKNCTFLYVGEADQKLEETENSTVTATSACSLEQNVTFEWFKIDVSTKNEERFNPKVSITSKQCDKCNHNSRKQTEKISIVPNGNGTKYYLKTNVIYGNGHIVSKQTSDAYEIEEEGPINEKLDDTQTVVGVLGVVGIVVVVVGGGGGVVGVAFYINKRKPHMKIFEFFKRYNTNKEDGIEEKADADPKAYESQCKTVVKPAQEEEEMLIVVEPAREEKDMLIVVEPAQEEKEMLIVVEPAQEEKERLMVVEPAQEEKEMLIVVEPAQEKNEMLIVVEDVREEEKVLIKTVDDDNKEELNDGTPSVIPDTGQSSLPSPNIVYMMKNTIRKEQAVKPIGTKLTEKGEAREIKDTDDKDILDDESAGKRIEGLGASHNVKETKKEDVEKRDGITGEKEVKEDKPFGYTHGLGGKESGISDGYNMSPVSPSLMPEKISNWSTKWSANTGPESVKGYSDQGSSEGCASPLVSV